MQNRAGYVYLLEAPEVLPGRKVYKVGRTKSPRERTKLFAVKLPFRWTLACVVPVDDMYEAEDGLHEYFSENHINGEWFELTETQVALFERIVYLRGTLMPTLYARVGKPMPKTEAVLLSLLDTLEARTDVSSPDSLSRTS